MLSEVRSSKSGFWSQEDSGVTDAVKQQKPEDKPLHETHGVPATDSVPSSASAGCVQSISEVRSPKSEVRSTEDTAFTEAVTQQESGYHPPHESLRATTADSVPCSTSAEGVQSRIVPRVTRATLPLNEGQIVWVLGIGLAPRLGRITVVPGSVGQTNMHSVCIFCSFGWRDETARWRDGGGLVDVPRRELVAFVAGEARDLASVAEEVETAHEERVRQQPTAAGAAKRARGAAK